MGNGCCGQFITLCLCHSLSLRGKTPHTPPLLQHEGSSHGRQFSTNFSNVSPSHGLQLFTNCPSMGLSHGVLSFRNRLLQRRSPTGSQALPANLLWHGLLSPQVGRTWQEPAPVWGSPRGHSFLQASTCSSMGSLPQTTSEYLLHHRRPWTAGVQPASLWSFTMGYKGRVSAPIFWALPFPPPSPMTLVSAELFLSHCLTPFSTQLFLLQRFFFPFLNLLSQRCCNRR